MLQGAGSSPNLLGDFADALAVAPDASARWSILCREFGALGADQINYGIIDTFAAERVEAPVRFLSTMDAGWIAFYGERRLDLHDPHVAFVRQGNLRPYFWGESVLEQIDDGATHEAVTLTVDAGLRAQLSVTMPDPLGVGLPVGGLTIGSSASEREYFGSISGKEMTLIGAAMLFHHYCIGEVRRSHAGAKPLSPRERDCLTLVALGYRVDRIEERLGLSRATIELHLRNARKKLKASTTGQAVARAMMFGDVQL